MPQADAIDRILDGAGTVAIVGYSDEKERPSRRVAAYLAERGYDVIPVNPRLAGTRVLGTTVVASLADSPRPVDTVVVFRRAEAAADVVREAAALGVRAVWLQEGIRSEEARAEASARGITFVMDACIMKEHRRRFGEEST